MIQEINFSFNCVLYCAADKKFRDYVKKCFTSCKKRLLKPNGYQLTSVEVMNCEQFGKTNDTNE